MLFVESEDNAGDPLSANHLESTEFLGRQVKEFAVVVGDASFELMVRSKKPDPKRKGGIVLCDGTA